MGKEIDVTNREFYNSSKDAFDAIPFKPILPKLLTEHLSGGKILEIGSGPGALAAWLQENGYDVTCIEPAIELAEAARGKGLKVHPITFQEYQPQTVYDSIVAISSLIHITKEELPEQIEKIANALKPNGAFFVSFIEGAEEGFEDPTGSGKERFFSKLTANEIDTLLSPYFETIETQKIYNPVMDRTFFLNVYARSTRIPSR